MSKAKSASAAMVKGGGKKVSKTDFIAQVASEVEVLTQPKAFALADELIKRAGEDDFRLGGVLAVVYDKCAADGNDAWLSGFDSFKTLVADRFGVQYRKAMYLIDIYKNLVEKQIPWDAVKDIGWAKLAKLASVITQKNVASWVEKAEKLTVDQLGEAVKKAKAKGGSNAPDNEPVTTKRLSVLLHGDQYPAVRKALDKGKKEGNTEFDSVSLFLISQAYLGNAVEMSVAPQTEKEKKAHLKLLMSDLGAEESLLTFEKVYPDWALEAKSPEAIAEEKAAEKAAAKKK